MLVETKLERSYPAESGVPLVGMSSIGLVFEAEDTETVVGVCF